MKPSELLAQVNDCFRDCPPVQEIMSGTTAALAWKGRTAAVMGEHSFVAKSTFDTEVRRIVSNQTRPEVWQAGYRTIMELLYEVQHDLRMKSGAVGSTAIARGGAFDYFNAIRKVIEIAQSDVLFVDPYLDAEFVERYLPHVHSSVSVRLLTSSKRLAALISSIDAYKNATRDERYRSARTIACTPLRLHRREVGLPI